MKSVVGLTRAVLRSWGSKGTMPVATARKKKASDKEASKEVEEERVMTGTKEVAAMAAAFDAAQKSVVAHRKGVRELRKVQEHMQFDDFAELLQVHGCISECPKVVGSHAAKFLSFCLPGHAGPHAEHI